MRAKFWRSDSESSGALESKQNLCKNDTHWNVVDVCYGTYSSTIVLILLSFIIFPPSWQPDWITTWYFDVMAVPHIFINMYHVWGFRYHLSRLWVRCVFETWDPRSHTPSIITKLILSCNFQSNTRLKMIGWITLHCTLT